MRSLFKNQQGFMLAELAVSLPLLVTAIAVLLLMYSFVNKTYLDSNKRAVIQSDVRLAIDSVLKDSRFSSELKIMDLSACKSEITNKQPYNYIYVENGSLYQMIYNAATSSYQQRVVASSISNTNTMFSKISDNTLGITFTAQDKEDASKSFSASSNIVLKNFEVIRPSPVIEGTAGLAIRYISKASTSYFVPVSSVEIMSESASISTAGGVLVFTAVVLPESATNRTVVWSVVNNTGAATIDPSGTLTAVSNGVVTVKASANDGSGISNSREIDISNQI